MTDKDIAALDDELEKLRLDIHAEIAAIRDRIIGEIAAKIVWGEGSVPESAGLAKWLSSKP